MIIILISIDTIIVAIMYIIHINTIIIIVAYNAMHLPNIILSVCFYVRFNNPVCQ